ncbi:hypothetical protein GTGU_01728 [Trabulsiella guamensis ATCC 49490]|uniref:Uncharacterized protein n=1 Tax=Trabulsiella guamensis ATCC 49490 TaxID=1005994 RepID=A0A085AC22_9ENTR|nr:hypothetical protein GTGU_01728 [Trabulsiella guamensis ATCC 49490]
MDKCIFPFSAFFTPRKKCDAAQHIAQREFTKLQQKSLK